MDPQKIRENMRRLSRVGEPGGPGGPSGKPRSGPAKPRWEPLPGDDLAEIKEQEEQEKRARELISRSDRSGPPKVKRGPRGGQYTEGLTKEGRKYRRYF